MDYAEILKHDDGTVMEEWIANLQSGKYQQTYGWLQCVPSSEGIMHTIGHCCLGVLCDQLGVPHDVDTQGGIVSYGGESSIPPLPIIRWLKDRYDIDANKLAIMNDGGMYYDELYDSRTFTEIADYLQRKTAPPITDLTDTNE